MDLTAGGYGRPPSDRHTPKPRAPLFHPKLFSTLREYSAPQFKNDVIAGLIVGVVALPLAIAFGIASGVTPQQGLMTAIVAGFLISLLGGSRVQIGGPTGAFVVIVYGIVQKYGLDGLTLCTLIAGAMLIFMGLFGIGNVIKFLPYPLTVGFTAGIAVIIFSSQIKDFFGLEIGGALPGDFISKWRIYFQTFWTFKSETLLLSVLALGILLVWPKISRKIPGSIVAIVVVTSISHFFHFQVATIGSQFGSFHLDFSLPHFPKMSFASLKDLVSPAFTVALLGAIESLLSATVADSMIEGRHRSNTELIAQGIANICSSVMGGIPATGAIARTATNVKNGARTPVAGIVHALTLFLLIMVFGRFASAIPLCVLSSILIVVSYYMSELHTFRNLVRSAPKMDVVVLLVTFALTVLVDLTVAVEVGMLLSLVLFMKRMSETSMVRQITDELFNPADESEWKERGDSVALYQIPKGVEVYEIEGALFFGVASTLRDYLRIGKTPPKVMILRMRSVFALDASGIKVLQELKKTCDRTHTTLVVSGLHSQPKLALENAGVLRELGQENVATLFAQAIKRAQELVGSKND